MKNKWYFCAGCAQHFRTLVNSAPQGYSGNNYPGSGNSCSVTVTVTPATVTPAAATVTLVSVTITPPTATPVI